MLGPGVGTQLGLVVGRVVWCHINVIAVVEMHDFEGALSSIDGLEALLVLLSSRHELGGDDEVDGFRVVRWLPMEGRREPQKTVR